MSDIPINVNANMICLCGQYLTWGDSYQCRDCANKANDEMRKEMWTFSDRINPNMRLADYERQLELQTGKNFTKQFLQNWDDEINVGVDFASGKDTTVMTRIQVSPSGRITQMIPRNVPIQGTQTEAEIKSVSKWMASMKRDIAAALAVPPDMLMAGRNTGVKKRTDEVVLQEIEELLVKSESLLNHFR